MDIKIIAFICLAALALELLRVYRSSTDRRRDQRQTGQ